MKPTKLFNLPLFLALVVFTLSSCEPNKPSQGTGTKRSYCKMTCVNTTSNYCAAIYVDGVALNELEVDGWCFWEGGWPLWAGRSGNTELSDIKFPKDIKIELHEIANETQFYSKVYKTFSKQSYSFSPDNDYKLTIREDGCTINYVSAK